jgi:transposase
MVKGEIKLDMEIVKRNESDKWEVLPQRWIVERTFAWLMNFRRLVMDYERTTESVESYIYIAMIMIMGKNFN